MSPFGWVAFHVLILTLLAFDLLYFQKKPREIRIREAVLWSVFWIILSLLFNGWIYISKGSDAALKFLTGYILEKSLSVDNLFVFLLIFSHFRIPSVYQHKILFWGILGALITRITFILCGVAIIEAFEWVLYILGAVLIWAGARLLFEKDKEVEPEKGFLLKLFRRLLPITPGLEGGRFLVKKGGRIMATPLLVTLVVIETTDIVFAIDSIPAVLAIARDPFIVYTSNIFAILGMRALFFALAGAMQLFHHLHYGLGAILIFVGIKMATEGLLHIPVAIALAVVVVILTLSIAASLIFPDRKGSGLAK
ncbi:MAG: TerC family protein [Candidatus Omnitrophica bacterium]|nr:TerC family protein [Candidatus Omnitrophota bacterium]